jgi:ABC-type branched-subunit amino acid transport system substrate-binding protein
VKRLILLCALYGLFPAWARAQDLVVGAVLSLSGPDARAGSAQAAALDLAARDLAARGLNLKLRVLDDRSNPHRAAESATTLTAEGAHALVCCSSTAVADAVRAALEGTDAPPTFALSHPSDARAPTSWFFSLEPGSAHELAQLAQHLLSRPRVALLAPHSPAGDTAEAVLRARLGERFVGSERYPPSSSDPLTPEALLAITRLPNAVVVWGERAGEALAALSARGYTGPVYLEAKALGGLSAFERARLRGGAGPEARAVVSPFELGFALTPEHPSAAQSARYRRASARSGGDSSLSGAYAWDALQLLGAALEQAYAYGLLARDAPDGAAPGDAAADRAATPHVVRLRALLREVLLGLEPLPGASAVLHPSAHRVGVAVSDALVAARWQAGAWRPLDDATRP